MASGKTAAEPPARASDPSGSISRYRFTVSDYYRMAEVGILRPADRVELIDGEIVEMAPIGSRHAACVTRLINLFARRAADRALVGAQNPVRLSDRSEPQPDIAILKLRSGEYADAHPGPDDVLLLVEVVDSTLRYDRDVKLPLYARAGIREVWIVDVEHDRLEVHRDPGPRGYARGETVERGTQLAPAALPDLVLDAAAVLGSKGE